MNNQPAHFRARVRVFLPEDGGPKQGFFGFSDTGHRAVPIEMDDAPNLNTVFFYYTPDAIVRGGDQFEADARVIHEESFAPTIRSGLVFRIWDGRVIAAGEVLPVYPEHWRVPIVRA